MSAQKRRAILVPLVFVLALARASAQELKFGRLAAERQFAQNSINCIIQDGRGFLWIGTQFGLHRYDGQNVKTYLADPVIPGSLGGNTVMAMALDRSKTLWVGTMNGGLNRYDQDRDRFDVFLSDSRNPNSLCDNTVFSLREDAQGTLWIGTSRGLSSLDPARRRFTSYRHDPGDANSIPNDTVNAVLEDRSGLLWIATDEGVTSFDRKRGRFRRFRFDWPNPGSINPNIVYCLYQDRRDNVLAGTSLGLYRFDPALQAFSPFPSPAGRSAWLSDDQVWWVEEDHAGTMWIATANGLVALDDAGRRTRHLSDPRRSDSLVNNTLVSLFVDRTGILWVASARGISYLTPFPARFDLWQCLPERDRSLSGDEVYGLCEDRRGIVWIGTNKGLDGLDRLTNRVIHYRHDPRLSDSLSAGTVTAVLEDRSGMLWVGTFGGGLSLFDRNKGTFRHLPPSRPGGEGPGGVNITSLVQDRHGDVWVGSYSGGLTRISSGVAPGPPLRFRSYRWDASDPKSIGSDDVTCILEDRRGVLWVGTDGGGLNEFHRDEETFIHHVLDPADPGSLSSNSVLTLLEDGAGGIWAGTRGGGLNRLDPKTGKFRRFGAAQGLPSDIVTAVLEDFSGRLWVSTNRGLAEFTPSTGGVVVYNEADGLQGDSFNSRSGLRTAEGDLFFGGSRGLSVVHPGLMRRNPFPPPVVITDLTLTRTIVGPDGRPKSLFPLPASGEVRLPYGDRFFALEFAALDFNNPSKNQHAFRLEGRDESWTYLGTSRRVFFNELEPGDYVFRVKGSNNSGVWNEDGARLRIVVLPPFWRTWPFFLLIVALAGGTAAGSVLLWKRSRALKRREKSGIEGFCTEHGVSARECDIIRLILEGKSYQEIAAGLFISLKTVKSHVYNIYQKLGIKNRLQLANFVRGRPPRA